MDLLNQLPSVANKNDFIPFWADFNAKLSDLFITDDRCKVGVFDLSASDSFREGVKSNKERIEWVSSQDELDKVLQQELLPGGSRLFILSRFNSWSRIDITAEMFKRLYTINEVIPEFLKIVMGLGRKHSSWDEDFMGCYSQFSPKRKKRVQQKKHSSKVNSRSNLSDLCYNIRHFERHGRKLEDPWSCRQSAIHHKHDSDKSQSNLIIIQPPVLLMSSLKYSSFIGQRHPMYIHIYYLSIGMAGWREYLNYLASRLKETDQRIGIHKPYGEFGVNFSSKQHLHNLQQKIHYACSILDKTLSILTTIRRHEETMSKICNLPQFLHEEFQSKLLNIINELEDHKQTVRRLSGFSNDIKSMYDDILKLYGQELLHNNGLALTQLAQANAQETKAMATIADKAYQDSRTTRIATVVAMIYLPANLVTSFFSTTFVWFDMSDGDQSGGEQSSVLRVHREIWIGILTTLGLIGCTTLTLWWWDRRERKQIPHQV